MLHILSLSPSGFVNINRSADPNGISLSNIGLISYAYRIIGSNNSFKLIPHSYRSNCIIHCTFITNSYGILSRIIGIIPHGNDIILRSNSLGTYKGCPVSSGISLKISESFTSVSSSIGPSVARKSSNTCIIFSFAIRSS